MKAAMRLGLRAGERLFINGAVLRVDRKVRLELLNDATFLLETHVMAQEQATTSLRRLYYLVQGVLIDPSMRTVVRPSLAASLQLIVHEGIDEPAMVDLRSVAELLDEERYFAALKLLRGMIKRIESEPTTARSNQVNPAEDCEVMA